MIRQLLVATLIAAYGAALVSGNLALARPLEPKSEMEISFSPAQAFRVKLDQAGMGRPGDKEIQLALFMSYGTNPPLYPK